MENTYKVGDIVIPHIPKVKDPGPNYGYVWVDDMDKYAEQEWEITRVKRDHNFNQSVYIFDDSGRDFSYYDFWLTSPKDSDLSITEDDLTNLLENKNGYS